MPRSLRAIDHNDWVLRQASRGEDGCQPRWAVERIDLGHHLPGTLHAEDVTMCNGRRIDKGSTSSVGDAVHKGTAYRIEHIAIISKELWDKVHSIWTESPRKRAASTRAQTPALLKGLIFGPTGCAMSPTHTRKGGKLYRY
jgi:hypothetical protein